MPFYRATTAAIARWIPFITPTTVSFLVASFTRASVATVVNSQGLIEVVAPDTPRFDHDPASGAPKGLLLEESRTNVVRQSNEFSNAAWGKFRITATSSPDFPIFASGNVFLLTGNGVSGNKVAGCTFTPFTTPFTMSVFMRRGTNNFAQLASYIDTIFFANFDLLNGVVGNNSALSTIVTPGGNGWYRCTLTTASTTANAFVVFIVSSATSPRAETNTLSTDIYVAGAQAELGAFATSYIPTIASAVTRGGDFASITGPNFSSWYNNPIQGTFGVEFQTLYICHE